MHSTIFQWLDILITHVPLFGTGRKYCVIPKRSMYYRIVNQFKFVLKLFEVSKVKLKRTIMTPLRPFILIIIHMSLSFYFERFWIEDMFHFVCHHFLGGVINIYRDDELLLETVDRKITAVRYFSFATDHSNGMHFYYNCTQSSSQKIELQNYLKISYLLFYFFTCTRVISSN